MSVHQCLEYVAIVTLTPWIDSLSTQRKLTAQDMPLFQQPRLTTLLLKLSSIEVFARADVQPLPYDNLRTFRLSASNHPSAALDKFLKNAGKLKKFEFHHNAHARLIDTTPPNFSELLQPCRNKLEILQLSWDCHEPLTFHGPGMAFGDFTALRYLAIPARALFGAYMWTKDINWLQMVTERIPPNVKIMYFDELRFGQLRRKRGRTLCKITNLTMENHCSRSRPQTTP